MVFGAALIFSATLSRRNESFNSPPKAVSFDAPSRQVTGIRIVELSAMPRGVPSDAGGG